MLLLENYTQSLTFSSLLFSPFELKMSEQRKGENNSLIYIEKNQNGTFRFLKPCTNDPQQAIPVPNSPLLSNIFPQNLTQWPSKAYFRGWLLPQKKWKQWVESLTPKYTSIWKQSGIYDAVMSSTYQVPRNQNLVLGLLEFWSLDTNTLVFPWGEATITLEDTMILGGFPVLGEPVTAELPKEMIKTKKIMEKERVKMCRSKSQKAAHCNWISRFMGTDDKLEHVAFLSLWLSRSVFPSASASVGSHIIPIAVKLSCGRKVALAPAVLASIYRDIRALKEGVMNSMETIPVSGPFQLVQLWALERFSLLGPKLPKRLKVGEPRVARWRKQSSKVTSLPLVRSALQVNGNFDWRPYAADLENWQHLSYYRGTKLPCSFFESGLDDELRSFFQCLKVCELVGIDCKEKYHPQRVAMQFGLDQDLPSDQEKFHFVLQNAKFFVPPRNSRGSASERYSNWWTDMMLNREKQLKGVLKKEMYAVMIKRCHGLVASSDRVNTQSSGKYGEDNNADTSTMEPIIRCEAVDIPPGFSAKQGLSDPKIYIQSESGVPTDSRKTNVKREKRKSHDVDGRNANDAKAKVEASFSNIEPIIDVDKLEEVAEPSNKRSKYDKVVAQKGTSNDPIDVEDSTADCTRKPQIPAHNIEDRVAKLEKMMMMGRVKSELCE